MLRRASLFVATAAHRLPASGARRPRPLGLGLARLSQLRPSPPTKYDGVAALKLQSRVLGSERCFSSTPVAARGKAGASVDPRHIRSPGIIVDPYTEGGADGEGSGSASSVSRRDVTPLLSPLHTPRHATARHDTPRHAIRHRTSPHQPSHPFLPPLALPTKGGLFSGLSKLRGKAVAGLRSTYAAAKIRQRFLEFRPNEFPLEARDLFRRFNEAYENGNRDAVRKIVTEPYFDIVSQGFSRRWALINLTTGGQGDAATSTSSSATVKPMRFLGFEGCEGESKFAMTIASLSISCSVSRLCVLCVCLSLLLSPSSHALPYAPLTLTLTLTPPNPKHTHPIQHFQRRTSCR